MRKCDLRIAVALCVVGLCTVGTAGANDLLLSTATTVRELLAIDAARALENERRQAEERRIQYLKEGQQMQPLADGDATDSEIPAPEPPGDIETGLLVEAIFGVGSALGATVTLNGRRMTFDAVGLETADGYRLARINVPCVRVTGRDRRSWDACMSGVTR